MEEHQNLDKSVAETFEGCTIIFRNVKEHYAKESSINCYFSTKENFSQPEYDQCFIGLFHVGWETLESCVSKKHLSFVQHMSKEDLYYVNLETFDVPDSNIGDFYQFCFFNCKTEVVYGASCPFEIYDSIQIESFIQIDNDDKLDFFNGKGDNQWWVQNTDDVLDEDSVLIHNKTTMLEKTLAIKVKENEELKALKANFEIDIMKLIGEKQALEKETKDNINMLNDKISFLEKRNLLLQQNLHDTEIVINHLTVKLENIRTELSTEYEKRLTMEHEAVEATRQEYNILFQEKEAYIRKLNETIQVKEQQSGLLIQAHSKIDDLTRECNIHKTMLLSEKKQYQSLEAAFQNMCKSTALQLETHGEKNSAAEELQLKYNDMEYKLTEENKKNSQLVLEAEYLSEIIKNLNKEIEKKDFDYHTQLDSTKKYEEKLQAEYTTSVTKLNCIISELQTQLRNKEEHYICEQKSASEELDSKRRHAEKLETVISNMESELRKFQILSKEEKETALKSIEELHKRQVEMENEIKSLNEVIIEKENMTSLSNDTTGHSLEIGARHALQVANLHILKKLKSLKQLYNQQQICTSFHHNAELKQQNEELKLRLHMGKAYYQAKYQECQKLKSLLFKAQSGCNKVAETKAKVDSETIAPTGDYYTNLCSENEQYKKKCLKLQQELTDCKEHEQALFQEVEELRVNSKKLAEHYDEKLKLLEEENKMIRKQKDALLKSETSYLIHNRSIVNNQPESNSEIVVYRPSVTSEQVIHKQPDILYPPSFMQKKSAKVFVSPNLTKETLAGYVKSSSYKENEEPVSQIIQNRETNLHGSSYSATMHTGRGQTKFNDHTKKEDKQSFACPVCQMDFPSGFSNANATAHVNSHFNEGL